MPHQYISPANFPSTRSKGSRGAGESKGLIAAGGTLRILIPPSSILLIIVFPQIAAVAGVHPPQVTRGMRRLALERAAEIFTK